MIDDDQEPVLGPPDAVQRAINTGLAKGLSDLDVRITAMEQAMRDLATRVAFLELAILGAKTPETLPEKCRKVVPPSDGSPRMTSGSPFVTDSTPPQC